MRPTALCPGEVRAVVAGQGRREAGRGRADGWGVLRVRMSVRSASPARAAPVLPRQSPPRSFGHSVSSSQPGSCLCCAASRWDCSAWKRGAGLSSGRGGELRGAGSAGGVAWPPNKLNLWLKGFPVLGLLPRVPRATAMFPGWRWASWWHRCSGVPGWLPAGRSQHAPPGSGDRALRGRRVCAVGTSTSGQGEQRKPDFLLPAAASAAPSADKKSRAGDSRAELR